MSNFDWNSTPFVVTCGGGLESLLCEEIQTIIGEAGQSVRGAVETPASLKNLYEICLRSRIASRVLLPLVRFPYKNEQHLYHQLRQVAWHEHFSVSQTFAVSTSKESTVNINTQFLTYRTKDAIVDHFQHFFQQRPNVSTRQPDMRVHVHFDRVDVVVSLDLSGEPLHRRGYRVAQNEAPIKESLAAAVLMRAGWPDASLDCLVDPMCGSGTLLIEAAMMQTGMVPGLLRRRFGFEQWQHHDEALWQSVIQSAVEQDQSETLTLSIRGYDSDGDSIQAALENIDAAGFAGKIHVERRELARFALPDSYTQKNGARKNGVLVCNPPYGERLDQGTQLLYLYRALGRHLQTQCQGWKVSMITNQVEYADALQLDLPQTLKVFNGPIRCVIRSGTVQARTPQFEPVPLVLQSVESDAIPAPDLLNRIRKNAKTLLKWANKESIYAYRIYDADMPEYNVAIDWYNGRLHVQEYAPPKSVDPAKAEQRLKAVLDTLKVGLGVPFSHLHVKSRQKQKGKQQYQKLNNKKQFYVLEEQGAYLLVNFNDYLDTGVFLDHRPTRRRLQTEAKGKRFLNLFCYTGAATVHAALGGAKKTVSVDMSPTYLNWARNNLYLNGFAESEHTLVNEDCMAWLRRTQEQFDLIFVDPPTFSNSKRMKGHFDVQVSHEELIDLAMKRLEPGGLLIFSNNFNRFQLSPELMTRYQMTEITPSTVPKDFARGKPIHRCWECRFKAEATTPQGSEPEGGSSGKNRPWTGYS